MQKLEKRIELIREKTIETAKAVVNAPKTLKTIAETRREALAQAHAQQTRIENARAFGRKREAVRILEQLSKLDQSETPDPAVVMGGARAILRAAGRDPETALGLVSLVQANEAAYNQLVLQIHTAFDDKVALAEQKRDELSRKPLAVGQRLSRITAALFQGDVKSLGDRVTIYPDKVIIRSPSAEDELGKLVVRPEKYLSGENYVAPSWPRWIGRIMNVVGSVLPDDKLEKLESYVPIGHVVFARAGKDTPDAIIPTWFPGRRAAQLSETFESMISPDPLTLPQFRPESSAGDLASGFTNTHLHRQRGSRVNRDIPDSIKNRLPKADQQ